MMVTAFLVFFFLLLLLLILGGGVVLALWLHRRGRESIPPGGSGERLAESSGRLSAQPVPATEATAKAGDRSCPRCGTVLAADSPEGLCPKCLLAAGIGTQPGTRPGGIVEAALKALDPVELSSQFPHLEIIDLIGQGGMGVVYKARQKQLDRIVALKVLVRDGTRDPAFAERFHREARTLARLNHPSIIGVHEFGQTDGCFYLVMEFVDGADLRHVLQERRLSPAEALQIVPSICDALQYAHANGVVHRDIKPGNILLDRQGRVKIADFGIAKLMGPETADVTLTQAQQSIGTLHYMAPEQVENPQGVDHRADIYSLGVVFYEMLTGELPLGRFSPPSRKVELDVRLDEVVLRTLEKEPERRYQQAGEVKTEVERIAAAPGRHAGARASKRRVDGVGRPPRKTRWAWAWALGFAVFLLLWFIFARGAGSSREIGFMGALLRLVSLVGALAPIGTTLLGCLALWDIRRGKASPVGLPSAAWAALLFPLLTLCGVIFAIGFLFLAVVLRIHEGIALTLLPLLVSAGTLGILFAWGGRRCWRGIRAWGNPGSTSELSLLQGLLPWIAGLVMILELIVVLGVMTAFIVSTQVRSTGEVAGQGDNGMPVPLGFGYGALQTWQMTAAGPVLHDSLMSYCCEDLDQSKRTELDQALTEAYRNYVDTLRANLTRTTNTEGHVVIQVRGMARFLDQVESDFLSVADTVLNADQQRRLREQFLLRPPNPPQPHREGGPVPSIGETFAPAVDFQGTFAEGSPLFADRRSLYLFRFGERPFSLEYWKVGQWFRWRAQEDITDAAQTSVAGPTHSAPDLPPDLKTLVDVSEKAGP